MLDETKTPALVKWAEAFVADPCVKGILPDILINLWSLLRVLYKEWLLLLQSNLEMFQNVQVINSILLIDLSAIIE